jgi:hypothetical protein
MAIYPANKLISRKLRFPLVGFPVGTERQAERNALPQGQALVRAICYNCVEHGGSYVFSMLSGLMRLPFFIVTEINPSP